MNDQQAILTQLNNCKDKLDLLFTSILKLEGEKTDVRIFTPASQHDEKWVIVARGYGLRIADEMISQIVSYAETDKTSLQWADMILKIVLNPNDDTLTLKPYVYMGEDVQACPLVEEETSTMTGDDYDAIDAHFMSVYASLKETYGNLYEICQQAGQYHTTLTHDLSQDVSLRFTANKGLDIQITCQDALTRLAVNTLSYHNHPVEFIAFFAADANGGKTKALPYGQQVGECVKTLNQLLTDFIDTYADNPYQQQYAQTIADDFTGTLVRLGNHIPYYRFGENIENVEDYPEVISVLDQLTLFVLNHVGKIPASAMGDELKDRVDHYAVDYENLLIYARDEHCRVLDALTDPQYALTPLLSNITEGAFALLSVHLSTLRNKHVFKKIGKLVMAEDKKVLH